MLSDPLMLQGPPSPGYSLQNERPKTTDNDSNDYIIWKFECELVEPRRPYLSLKFRVWGLHTI
jgi:hypothetical protein